MKKLLIALALLVVAALPSVAADQEFYRTENRQHVFTIKGKDYFVPITAEIDFTIAQSAARKVAADVANGIPLGGSGGQTRLPETVYSPYRYILPQESCPNGQCPNATPRRR